ncbi:hypothetical protein RGR602_PB00418 (plasmid) [Rhizobium gallicum bv. gallicum R602sp]|uniref:HTH IS21-type domain-containing protein n=1 Tax=Rhizobium gallicum bv. gallicum R602sp TaxID=1041138 RepID=A0A0B4XBI8_9HYPH|nr:hypothetical protein RGR602_PB00418 [Rhizobium gallicum bv. gallicum R602sp]
MQPVLASRKSNFTVEYFSGVMMILDLHRQGLSVSAVARQAGIDRKTVRKYIERGLEAPVYGPRATVIDPFAAYLRERVQTYPALTARVRILLSRGADPAREVALRPRCGWGGLRRLRRWLASTSSSSHRSTRIGSSPSSNSSTPATNVAQ